MFFCTSGQTFGKAELYSGVCSVSVENPAESGMAGQESRACLAGHWGGFFQLQGAGCSFPNP